jgi:cephalosporin-C deacetylase-like acetyl esterase
MEKGMKPLELHRMLLEKTVPFMAYSGKEDFYAWKTSAKKKLEELLGLPFIKTEPDLRMEFQNRKTDCGGVPCLETRFTFQSEENYRLPCHLLLPESDKKTLPLIICLQGHSKGMHISLGRPVYEGDDATISGGDRDFAVQVLKEGYAALTIEQRCFGECGGTADGPDCYEAGMTALLLGRTIIGERVWDISRAIDVIEQYFPVIDSKKIGCMGNSGGGTATYYAACMEERISIAMVSCALCSFRDSIANCYHCSCNYIPTIGKYFEMGDLAGLIAPRPLLAVAGREDSAFPMYGVKSQGAFLLYPAAAGSVDKVKLIEGSEGHRFYADLAWPVFNELSGWTQGCTAG